MKYCDFHRVLERSSSTERNNHCTLIEKDITTVLQNHIAFCSKEGIFFCLERRNTFARVFPTSITMDYTCICYNTVNEVIGSHNGGNLWFEKEDGSLRLFVVYVQIVFDSTTMKVKTHC